MRDAINRILSSQKAIYAMIPTLANVVAGVAGIDPTTPLLLALDAGFAGLLLMQWVLDLRWGSPSDGTGTFRTGGTAALLLVCVLGFAGCASASISPDGTVEARAFGQSRAIACPADVEPSGDIARDTERGCVVLEGGPLSDNLTRIVTGLLALPFRALGSAVQGLAGGP